MLDSGEERGELLGIMASRAPVRGGDGRARKGRAEIAAEGLSLDHGRRSSSSGRVVSVVEGVCRDGCGECRSRCGSSLGQVAGEGR
jgi:hypothetical protein